MLKEELEKCSWRFDGRVRSADQIIAVKLAYRHRDGGRDGWSIPSGSCNLKVLGGLQAVSRPSGDDIVQEESLSLSPGSLLWEWPLYRTPWLPRERSPRLYERKKRIQLF